LQAWEEKKRKEAQDEDSKFGPKRVEDISAQEANALDRLRDVRQRGLGIKQILKETEKGAQVRDDWMTSLPKEFSLTNDPNKVTARSFSKRGIQKRESAGWTEAPLQKEGSKLLESLKREEDLISQDLVRGSNEDDVTDQPKVNPNSTPEAAVEFERKQKEERAAKVKAANLGSRSSEKSLVELHAEKLQEQSGTKRKREKDEDKRDKSKKKKKEKRKEKRKDKEKSKDEPLLAKAKTYDVEKPLPFVWDREEAFKVRGSLNSKSQQNMLNNAAMLHLRFSEGEGRTL